MAQPSMPFGVFRGKSLDEWAWYVADPGAGDVATTIEGWRSANASSNKPPWRRVLFWVEFAVIVLVVGVVIPFFFYAAREIGTYGFMLLAGLAVGLTGAWKLDSLFGEPDAPRDDPRVARLDPNLESWVTAATPLADVWELNAEVACAVALEELRVDASDPALAPGIRGFIDEQRAEQVARVREVGTRVGYAVPADGFELDED
jgi:hypothetical protein